MSIEKDLEDICINNGLVDSGKNIYIDPKLNNRYRYYNEYTGYEETEYFINTQLSKSIANISGMTIIIERNLKILSLMDVGESVKFINGDIETTEISGKYILKSSILNWTRAGQIWESTARVDLIRTNKLN